MDPATLNFWSVFSIVLLLWLVMDYWSTHDRFKEMEQEVADLRARLAEAQSEVTRLAKKAEANDENMKKLRATLDRANANTQKGNETILMLVNRVKALENRVDELREYAQKVRNDVDDVIYDLSFAPAATCKTKRERRLKQAYLKLVRNLGRWHNYKLANAVDGTTVVAPKIQIQEEQK